LFTQGPNDDSGHHRHQREFDLNSCAARAYGRSRTFSPATFIAAPATRKGKARTRRHNGCGTGSAYALKQRDLIISLATRYRLPNVYGFRYYPESGGLASYGPNPIEAYGRAAGYVDRILKGEKPADLPVQAPTKLELVVNLKTAKAIGLTIPGTVLARADEIIE
jgi:ABC transporter substrate binding protein